LVGSGRADVEQDCRCDGHYDEREVHGSSSLAYLDAAFHRSITIALALAPRLIGLRPAVIRVRITKSAIARNGQRDALFQRSHAAIIPDVLPDVFYRAPRTLVGSGGANIQPHCRYRGGQHKNESHDRLANQTLIPTDTTPRFSPNIY
jgi:hypothetical protein